MTTSVYSGFTPTTSTSNWTQLPEYAHIPSVEVGIIFPHKTEVELVYHMTTTAYKAEEAALRNLLGNLVIITPEKGLSHVPGKDGPAYVIELSYAATSTEKQMYCKYLALNHERFHKVTSQLYANHAAIGAASLSREPTVTILVRPPNQGNG